MPLPLFRSSRWRSWRAARRGLLLAVAGNRRDSSRLLVADHADDANAIFGREVEGVEHLAVIKVLVGLEVHDLVVARALHVDLVQRATNVRRLNGLLVQVVIAVLVDAEHLVRLIVFG